MDRKVDGPEDQKRKSLHVVSQGILLWSFVLSHGLSHAEHHSVEKAFF